MFLRASAILALSVVLSACSSVVSTLAEPTHEAAPSIPPSVSAQPAATLTGSIFDAPCTQLAVGDVESHLREGNQVTVSDGSGNVLALGRLDIDPDSPSDCNFIFTVNEVPSVPFYSIVIGSYPPLVYTVAELDSKDWHLKLALDYRGDLGALGSE